MMTGTVFHYNIHKKSKQTLQLPRIQNLAAVFIIKLFKNRKADGVPGQVLTRYNAQGPAFKPPYPHLLWESFTSLAAVLQMSRCLSFSPSLSPFLLNFFLFYQIKIKFKKNSERLKGEKKNPKRFIPSHTPPRSQELCSKRLLKLRGEPEGAPISPAAKGPE